VEERKKNVSPMIKDIMYKDLESVIMEYIGHD
jgi:hypothetical protein